MSEAASAGLVVAAVRRWQSERDAGAEAGGPAGALVVAIDGYGASGKTTIADLAAAGLEATVVHTDDFLHIAVDTGDKRPMAQYYDWTRLRAQALLPALSSDAAVVIVEGVSAACAALTPPVTRAVFVDTPEPVRRARLRGRIAPQEWDEDWLAAEREYFASRPPASFHLVVPGV